MDLDVTDVPNIPPSGRLDKWASARARKMSVPTSMSKRKQQRHSAGRRGGPNVSGRHFLGSRSGATGFEVEPVGRDDSHGLLGLAGTSYGCVLHRRCELRVSCVAELPVSASIMRGQHDARRIGGKEKDAGLEDRRFGL